MKLLVSAAAVALISGVGIYEIARYDPSLNLKVSTTYPLDLSCPKEKPDKYVFSKDWFTNEGRIPVWTEVLKPFAGKRINYLEIGIFEGRSMTWMLENILTNPASKATGIDIYVRPTYLKNLSKAGGCDKVTNIQAPSQEALKKLPKDSFDVIYIDGSHTAKDALADAILSYDLLKVGGIIIFDDYEWLPTWPGELTPKLAVDSFVAAYKYHLKTVHNGYQYIVQKTELQCPNDADYSPVGRYCYVHNTGELERGKEKIELNPEEKSLVIRYIKTGKTDPMITRFF